MQLARVKIMTVEYNFIAAKSFYLVAINLPCLDKDLLLP